MNKNVKINADFAEIRYTQRLFLKLLTNLRRYPKDEPTIRLVTESFLVFDEYRRKTDFSYNPKSKKIK